MSDDPYHPKEFFNRELLCSIYFDEKDGSNKEMDELVTERLKPLSAKAMEALKVEVVKALQLGKDVTFCVTIGGKYFWDRDDFKGWVSNFLDHVSCKRIASSSNNAVVMMTDEDMAVTILLFGHNKLDMHIAKPPRTCRPIIKAKRKKQDEDDDDFEEDQYLSQQVQPLQKYARVAGKVRNCK
ncbi:hypothetical protein SEMRO_31_G020520.1 [Seminavis robusta]|uniref:Uncharacterized protein n=1 Tax=Seminavis robusta TaxID=568900 RepID=A0A9N8D851_9STRA|nr:hypothetical protein SEMRO_31_G020520.1 [Seminavis robusta]|eukprot:Sro31_g020520.1 n/a (183) ;mRNA; f:148354-148902